MARCFTLVTCIVVALFLALSMIANLSIQQNKPAPANMRVVGVVEAAHEIRQEGKGRVEGRKVGKGLVGGKGSKWASEVEELIYPTINISAVNRALRSRRQQVREMCHQHLTEEELLRPPNSKEFLINIPHSLVWCNIFKSASSSWLYNFLLLAGYTDQDMKESKSSPVEFARMKAYPRPSVEKLNETLVANFTSFLVVREPFQRLLSAYRDKIESTKQGYYKPLRCLIYKVHDKKRPRAGRDCQPSFRAFVDYLLQQDATNHAPNEHWAPYHTFCSPCQVDFDYILRFENLAEEEAFLVQVLGLEDVIKPQRLHASHTNYTNVAPLYFNQLSPSQLQGLYNIYRKDFLLFGYDASPYMESAVK